MPAERVTVTLPEDVVEEIDRRERNRSRFVLAAVLRELERLRQEELARSLEHPHAESEEVAEAGLSEWRSQMSEGDEDLLDASAGRGVRWEPGKGWVEVDG